MIAQRRFMVAAISITAAAGLLAAQAGGVFAMSDKGSELVWQWRAGRVLEQRAALKVDSVKKVGGGMFGILQSPSLAGSLPDPHVVASDVIIVDRGGPAKAGARLTFRIPAMELKQIKADDTIGVGIIGNAVVCVAPLPPGTKDDLLARLRELNCG